MRKQWAQRRVNYRYPEGGVLRHFYKMQINREMISHLIMQNQVQLVQNKAQTEL